MKERKKITCMLHRMRGCIFNSQRFSIRRSVLNSIKHGVGAGDEWVMTGEEPFFVLKNMTNLLR